MPPDESVPQIVTVVVQTPDGQKELLLHPKMEILRDKGKMHIVNGEIIVPVPESYAPYQTTGKIFPGTDGKLYKLSTVKSISDHPDDISPVMSPVLLRYSDFLGLGIFEIQRIGNPGSV